MHFGPDVWHVMKVQYANTDAEARYMDATQIQSRCKVRWNFNKSEVFKINMIWQVLKHQHHIKFMIMLKAIQAIIKAKINHVI